MLYLYTNSDIVKNYWKKEFHSKYIVKEIRLNLFDENFQFKIEDIFIFDIDQFSTVEEVMELYKVIPKTLKVIVLIDSPRLSHGAFFIKQGIKSYIGKKTSKIIIDQAIKTVLDGNVWLYPQLMNYIIKHMSISNENKNSSKNSMDQLTIKEQNVANYVAEGLSNKEIAKNLNIQLVTVKKHISSIFTKLEVKDRVALAILINSQ